MRALHVIMVILGLHFWQPSMEWQPRPEPERDPKKRLARVRRSLELELQQQRQTLAQHIANLPRLERELSDRRTAEIEANRNLDTLPRHASLEERSSVAAAVVAAHRTRVQAQQRIEAAHAAIERCEIRISELEPKLAAAQVDQHKQTLHEAIGAGEQHLAALRQELAELED